MTLEGNLKCVIVGDGAVGKTCLLYRYTANSFPGDYIPTIFDNYSCNISVEGKNYKLSLFDTAGQEDYDRFRLLCYHNPVADVFLVCFSVISIPSLKNVLGRWKPELDHHCPSTPTVLLGTKTDLRTDSKTLEALSAREQKPITKEQGEKTAKELGAAAYAELSAYSGEGVQEAFGIAISVALNPEYRKKSNSNGNGKGGSSTKKDRRCVLF